MARPTIRDLGPAPSLSDPATFPARADATVGKLGQLVTDINGFGQWAETELIDQANAAANATALAHVGAAETAKTAAEAAKVKSQDWADKAEDAAVETGKYSAKHHAAKAAANAAAAATSKAGADTAKAGADTAKAGADSARTAAEAAKVKSQDWADKAEDTAVETGKYSAKHHAAKAAASASAAATARAGADTAKAGADNAKAAAEAAKVSAEASAVAVNVGAIAAVKAETAVDVLIYDTSRDSDGGAWRHRCQHTSWFNEALNTATRGKRREFPSVAVIVAEVNRVTIYDGDDPALPMWMTFEGSFSWATGTMLLVANASAPIASVAARDGKLLVGSKNAAGASESGLHTIDFVLDRAKFNGVSADYLRYTAHPGIASRNDPLGRNGPLSGDKLIAGSRVTDIAITVLPQAPIDGATGLPVPTVAVALDVGGVSILKHDGNVWDITGSNWGSYGYMVGFVRDELYFSQGFHLEYAAKVGDLKQDYSFGDRAVIVPFRRIVPAGSYFTSTVKAALAVESRRLDLARAVDAYNAPLPHVAIAASRQDDWARGMAAQISTDYNTGWIVGDGVGAWLSDTDTSTPGAEILSGNQRSLVDKPAAYDGAVHDSSGHADPDGGTGAIRITHPVNDGKNGYFFFDAPATVHSGKQLIREVWVKGSGTLVWGSGSNLNIGGHSSSIVLTSQWQKVKIYCSAGGTRAFQLQNLFFGDEVYLYAPSVKSMEMDRSANGRGLEVFGAPSRAPVAAGAELVGYSGFSAGSYLKQPYNDHMNFGTGDFSLMCWVKANGNTAYIVDMATPSGGKRWFAYVNDAGKISVNGSIIGTSVVSDNIWHHIAIVRRDGLLMLYIDGRPDGSVRDSYDFDGGAGMVETYVGVRNTLTLMGAVPSLALLRMSKTAPTAEQIAKIIADERALFQPGAGCTIYGTSRAVAALAHDPVKDLLHVGTSAGRSVFQGLRRVENTTQAVGAAISAVGGLVADE